MTNTQQLPAAVQATPGRLLKACYPVYCTVYSALVVIYYKALNKFCQLVIYCMRPNKLFIMTTNLRCR